MVISSKGSYFILFSLNFEAEISHEAYDFKHSPEIKTNLLEMLICQELSLRQYQLQTWQVCIVYLDELSGR